MSKPLELEWLQGRFAVGRLDPDAAIPEWAFAASGFVSVTRTDRELSIVAREDDLPRGVDGERGWVMLRVAGTLDFALVGILARLTGVLAEAGVPVFTLSTFETDYLLMKADLKSRAERALGTVANLRDSS